MAFLRDMQYLYCMTIVTFTIQDGGVSIFKFDHAKGRCGGTLARPASVECALSVQIGRAHV